MMSPAWKPLLDKYEISVVMIDPADAQNTYRRLLQSPNWIAFYDDGQIVMFGRADAPASDVAFFKANVLDADRAGLWHESRDRRGRAAAQSRRRSWTASSRTGP